MAAKVLNTTGRRGFRALYLVGAVFRHQEPGAPVGASITQVPWVVAEMDWAVMADSPAEAVEAVLAEPTVAARVAKWPDDGRRQRLLYAVPALDAIARRPHPEAEPESVAGRRWVRGV